MGPYCDVTVPDIEPVGVGVGVGEGEVVGACVGDAVGEAAAVGAGVGSEVPVCMLVGTGVRVRAWDGIGIDELSEAGDVELSFVCAGVGEVSCIGAGPGVGAGVGETFIEPVQPEIKVKDNVTITTNNSTLFLTTTLTGPNILPSKVLNSYGIINELGNQ